MKLILLAKFLERVLFAINLITVKFGVHPFYNFYDTCAFFLVKFKDFIDVGPFTEITFGLIKRNASKRNEDLLYMYRQKIQDNIGDVTIGYLQ
jgi:hypothetical protein